MALTPSFFIEFLTEKSWFFASAAEGFFAISGILVGYIYGPRILKNTAQIVKKILKRAGLLYVLSILFTFLYSAWALSASINPIGLGQPIHDTTQLVFQTLTLQHSFGWVDFLSRYAVFMTVAPIVLLLVAKNKTWVAIGVSVLFWLFSQFNSTLLPYSAWQIIFVIGIVIGYYLPTLEDKFRNLNPKTGRRIVIVLLSAGVSSYILSVLWLYSLQFAHQIAPPEHIGIFNILNLIYLNINPLFSRDTIGIGRLLVGTLWFATIYFIFRIYEKPIQRITRGCLELLGKNSLFVYCLQGFLIFFMNLFITAPSRPDLLLNTIIGILFVVFMYILLYIKVVFFQKE